jgi:hypothetical protein
MYKIHIKLPYYTYWKKVAEFKREVLRIEDAKFWFFKYKRRVIETEADLELRAIKKANDIWLEHEGKTEVMVSQQFESDVLGHTIWHKS